VEHHRGFAEHLSPTLRSFPTVRLFVVPPVPGTGPKAPSGKEGHEDLDFTGYVATIDHVKGQFDLIVVDGRARSASPASPAQLGVWPKMGSLSSTIVPVDATERRPKGVACSKRSPEA
jgi:hypothetical protein